MKRLGPSGEIRGLMAHFEAFSFTKHEHDHFVVGLVGAGLQAFELGTKAYVTPPGHLILINPGEPHTGRAASGEGFSYLALYPERDDLVQFQEGADLRASGRLAFRETLVRDEGVHGRLWTACRRVDLDPLARETGFVLAVRELLRRHATCQAGPTGPRAARRELRIARDFLHAHLASRITLGDLARASCLSPYHLARMFTSTFGLPPHKYLEGLRVERARASIAAGMPLAEAALASGFSSQSHLNRSFKRILGVTPAASLP
ncbi:MAG TPA: AraC family transcriptional regulator [Holophaga sp.]|nr:AraC family transcriptional regulator [Holophaga sp.]